MRASRGVFLCKGDRALAGIPGSETVGGASAAACLLLAAGSPC